MIMDNFNLSLEDTPKKTILENIHQHTVTLKGIISGMCNRVPEVTNAYIGYHENEEGDTESVVAVTFQHGNEVYTVPSFLSNIDNEEEKEKLQFAVTTNMTKITKDIAEEFNSRNMPLPSGIIVSVIQGTPHYNIDYSDFYESPEYIVTNWIDQMHANPPMNGSVFAPGALQIMFPSIELGEEKFDD